MLASEQVPKDTGPTPALAGSARDLAAAARHVREVVMRSGSSFIWGMRVLPQARREAMYAIYAFCREVDDIADGPDPAADKIRRLAEWRAEIDRLYDGAPTRPTTLALAGPVRDFDLPKAEFLAMIEGMEMDADDFAAAPSMADFKAYCRRVAGAVGLLSVRAFGATRPPADEFALTLGDALQFTNILRDIREDADMGRLYLPRELLEGHGITSTELDAVLAHPNLPAVCAELAEMAAERFRESGVLAAQCDRHVLRPALIMMGVYSRILDRLRRRGWERFDQPVRLSRPEKLWIVAREGLF